MNIHELKRERQQELNELLKKITKEFNKYGVLLEFDIDVQDVSTIYGTKQITAICQFC